MAGDNALMAVWVAEGFGLALTSWIFIWGMTLPIRWFLHMLGIGK